MSAPAPRGRAAARDRCCRRSRWRILDASGQAFWQGFAINLGIFIILTVSLNLTSGFTGVFSLGQIGFMALGAYVSAILTLPLEEKASYLPDLPAWLAGVHLDQVVGPVPAGFLAATLIAAALVSVIAWLVGRVLMRLSGHFVAVATLGFLVIVRVLLFNADAFTRGSRTFSNVTPYTNLWWTGAWALLVVYVVWRIKRSLVRARDVRPARGPRRGPGDRHPGHGPAAAGVRGRGVLLGRRRLAVRPLHHVVLADGLLLRPDVPGHHDAGRSAGWARSAARSSARS